PLELDDVADRVLGRLESPPARDQSFRSWLADQRDVSEQDAEWMLRYVEGFHAADLDRVGVHWLSHTVGESGGGGGEQRYHALSGFDGVVRALHAAIAHRCDIRLGTSVTAIEWETGGVTVRAGEHEVGAEAVIITLPLGVLQHGNVRFDPPLDDTIGAARAIAAGSVVKVVFRFDTMFWNDIVKFDGDDSRERKFLMCDMPFPTWWTPSPVLAPLLTAWAGGGAADHVRTLGDPVGVAIDSLAGMLRLSRRDVEAHIENVWFHDWVTDPFARCAYSYVPAGAMPALATLRRPVADTIFIAGEATAPDGWNGTVDGAIQSGRRAAAELERSRRSATTGR